MKYLDTVRGFVYKLGPKVWAALVAATIVLSWGQAGAAEVVLGVPMPKRATPDGPYRYLVPGTSFKDVVKFFKKKFKRASHVFIDALDHPEARVIHIRSGSSATAWEGINLWIRQRQVQIFVIPRKGVAPEARKEPRGQEEG